MWIMVEPVAEIPFGIRRSPTRCYGCNKVKDNKNSKNSKNEIEEKRAKFASRGLLKIRDW
jgi:hypothetical protein